MRTSSTWSGAVVLVCAAVLGAGMQVAEPLLGLPNSVSALGAPWLVCAFGVGALLRRPLHAAVAGAAMLVAGTALYYAALVYGYGASELRYALTMALAWGGVAAVAGAAMALIGTLWRDAHGRRAVVLGAVPAAALAGEALLLRATWGENATALLAEAAVAALLLALLARRRAPLPAALVAAAALALVFAGVEAEVRDALRAAGWHGA